MIVGLGIDLVEIARIEALLARYSMTFVQKLLHETEIEQGSALPPSPPYSRRHASFLAARFAAKEAAVKALGTGFSGGIGLHDVRVVRLPSGVPSLEFFGEAKKRFLTLGAHTCLLSLSHEKSVAGAVVVLEAPSCVTPSETD